MSQRAGPGRSEAFWSSCAPTGWMRHRGTGASGSQSLEMIGSRARTPVRSSIRSTAREPLITRNRPTSAQALCIRISRWIPVESMKLNFREVHDDHFDIVIPEDGVECAFEERRRR